MKATVDSTSFIALVLLVSAPAASGQESFRDHKIDARFAAADKNQDGKLTLEEAQAGMPKVAANFDKIDTPPRAWVCHT